MASLPQETISVLIPDGELTVSLYAARCLAQSQKVKLYILSSQRWTKCRFSRHRGSYEFKPLATDREERFKATVDMIKRFHIDVILPVAGKGIELVATKRQALSEMAALALVPDRQAFRITADKWLLHQLACEHQVPVPLSILATFDSTFYQQLSGLEYPVLLKPTVGEGGQGIYRFDTPSDLQGFLERQDEEHFKNNYIVQSYLPGTSLGLNVLCREGQILAFTIQRFLMAEPFGPPKAMQFIEQEEVLENGRKLVSALNWNGVANIDMRYDSRDGQVKVLEVNPRFWATLLGSLVVGVNFPYLSCLEALGIPFPMPQYQHGKYVQMGTAIKEMALRLFGQSNLDGFGFRETGLRFFLTDPWPDIVNYTARGVQYGRKRGLIPPKVKFLDEFLTDWLPGEYPKSPYWKGGDIVWSP